MAKLTSHCENFLLDIFKNFASFSYDKAKEQTDKQRDLSKTLCSGIWTNLLVCVSQLASVEKLYMNLTFLTPKGFLRRESSVRLTYETILTELDEMEIRFSTKVETSQVPSTYSSTPGTPDKISTGVLLHIRTHLIIFIQARLLMLSFYEKLISSSTGGKIIDYEEMLNYISEIIQKNNNSFHHPVLAPIKTTFTYECDIMHHLLGCLNQIQEWNFLAALMHLNDANSKIVIWQTMVQSRESKKYNFSSSFLKSSPLPALFQWFINAKTSIMNKFTLYFYEPLVDQAPHGDLKSLQAKQNCDYINRIQNFVKKVDAQYVCIVMSSLTQMKRPGYNHPSREVSSPTGMESYPAIFSFPHKPMKYWASIVMNIEDRCFDNSALTVHEIFDPQINVMFYWSKIEPRIYLVTLFEFQERPVKENHQTKTFITDFVSLLRCTKVFQALNQA